MRTTRLVFLGAAAVALVWACGPGAPTVTPVKQVPLAGTIGGTPFTGVSALVSGKKAFGEDGGKWLDVYDKAIGCKDFPSGSNKIIGTLPWTVTEYDFSFAKNLTLVSGNDNKVATNGRMEIVSAPPPDAGLGKIRIRAIFNSDNTVEGEIDVVVCD